MSIYFPEANSLLILKSLDDELSKDVWKGVKVEIDILLPPKCSHPDVESAEGFYNLSENVARDLLHKIHGTVGLELFSLTEAFL